MAERVEQPPTEARPEAGEAQPPVPAPNTDPREVARFDALAQRWWDPEGPMRALHWINPARLDYVASRCSLEGRRVLDVGCGGGLLAEALAEHGAQVTGIDLSGGALAVARLHAAERGLAIDYRQVSAEALAEEAPEAFDVVICMELLEHVPDLAALVQACARLARPGGHLFFSTLNRTLRAYLTAILGAEYLLGLLPRGTHDYGRFIRPSELARWLRAAGLELVDLRGLVFDPLARRFRLGRDVAVNYLVHAIKEGHPAAEGS